MILIKARREVRAIGLIVITIACVLLWQHLWRPSGIVAVDLTALTQSYIETLASKPLTPSQSEALMQAFANNLQTTLGTYSRRHHVVIVPRQAIIAGAPDETRNILQLMQQNAKAKGGDHET